MISFIETQLFTRLVQEYLSEEDFQALQRFLLEQPDAGKVVRGSGGVCKRRWKSSSQGKSGGFRVIYLAKLEKDVI